MRGWRIWPAKPPAREMPTFVRNVIDKAFRIVKVWLLIKILLFIVTLRCWIHFFIAFFLSHFDVITCVTGRHAISGLTIESQALSCLFFTFHFDAWCVLFLAFSQKKIINSMYSWKLQNNFTFFTIIYFILKIIDCFSTKLTTFCNNFNLEEQNVTSLQS